MNGEIQRVARADRDVVYGLVERDPTRVDVWFFGHNGIFHFDRSQPSAKRIYDTLAKSKKSGSRVWFVTTPPDLRVADVASEDELPRTE